MERRSMSLRDYERNRGIAKGHSFDSSRKIFNDGRPLDNYDQVRENVTVVVLGDVGHSPRMNYHALSLSQEGFEVNLVGLAGAKPSLEVLEDSHITITYMRPCPKWFTSLPKLLGLLFKVAWQAVILFFTLLLSATPSKLLLQNPPGVPALPVCWFYCFIVRAKFIVDWHNYGFSIMALSLGSCHLVVRVYRFIEMFFGRRASSGLSVTHAMKDDLETRWDVQNIVVHYDKPHSRFHPLNDGKKHDFYLKMSRDYSCFSSCVPDKTVFTQRFADGRIEFYDDRPAILVSSTSWTEDEDFSILLHALQDYEKVKSGFPDHYPKLVVVITGKGPLKEKYITDIRSRNWQHIEVITPWLSHEDYAKLLASADMGVCLHYSSSGFDLPMKVVDMFGCGLPVMAVYYPTLAELVKHNENGLVFAAKEELANMLQDWFRGFPKETALKEHYYDFYRNINVFRKATWHNSWKTNVLSLFQTSKETKQLKKQN